MRRRARIRRPGAERTRADPEFRVGWESVRSVEAQNADEAKFRLGVKAKRNSTVVVFDCDQGDHDRHRGHRTCRRCRSRARCTSCSTAARSPWREAGPVTWRSVGLSGTGKSTVAPDRSRRRTRPCRGGSRPIGRATRRLRGVRAVRHRGRGGVPRHGARRIRIRVERAAGGHRHRWGAGRSPRRRLISSRSAPTVVWLRCDPRSFLLATGGHHRAPSAAGRRRDGRVWCASPRRRRAGCIEVGCRHRGGCRHPGCPEQSPRRSPIHCRRRLREPADRRSSRSIWCFPTDDGARCWWATGSATSWPMPCPPAPSGSRCSPRMEVGVTVDPGIEHRVFTIGDGEQPQVVSPRVEDLCSAWARWGLDAVGLRGGGGWGDGDRRRQGSRRRCTTAACR